MTLTASDIRTYVKDKEEFNVLLEGELQSDNALIELAMRMTVSDFNGMAPISSAILENFPNDSVLLYGTLYHLANGEAEKQLRNNVNFSAQGMQASIDDKFSSYTALAQFYKQLFEQRAKELKHAMNMAEAWGESFSPYAGINDHNFRN
jgi:hypothetical protein